MRSLLPGPSCCRSHFLHIAAPGPTLQRRHTHNMLPQRPPSNGSLSSQQGRGPKSDLRPPSIGPIPPSGQGRHTADGGGGGGSGEGNSNGKGSTGVGGSSYERYDSTSFRSSARLQQRGAILADHRRARASLLFPQPAESIRTVGKCEGGKREGGRGRGEPVFGEMEVWVAIRLLCGLRWRAEHSGSKRGGQHNRPERPRRCTRKGVAPRVIEHLRGSYTSKLFFYSRTQAAIHTGRNFKFGR